MPHRPTLLLAALTLLPLAAPAADYLSALEQNIIRETNAVRTDPASYIPYLEDRAQRFDGRVLQRDDAPDLVTQEGVSAVNEAIEFLKNAAPVPALEPSEGLSKAAADLVEYAGPRGLIGHEGKAGSRVWDRVERYGDWQRTVAENISYGPDEARQIVLGWIIDDGVADRGHRKNLFRDALRITGTACGPHESYGTMCVATYAGGFRPR